jgi:hypothetical protein
MYLIFWIIVLIISSCQDTGPPNLEGCCDNKPIIESFGNAQIYLANIFTPNNDGVNDYCYLQGDSVYMIKHFEIRDNKDNIVFITNNVEANNATFGWDGKIDGLPRKGVYSVYLVIEALNGSMGKFDGKICNYPCGLMDGEELIPIDGCRFPIEWHCWEYDDGCQYLDYPGCFE